MEGWEVYEMDKSIQNTLGTYLIKSRLCHDLSILWIQFLQSVSQTPSQLLNLMLPQVPHSLSDQTNLQFLGF